VRELLRKTNGTSADGIFLDTGDTIALKSPHLTVASRQDMLNATAKLWKALVLAGSTAAKKFIGTPSFVL